MPSRSTRRGADRLTIIRTAGMSDRGGRLVGVYRETPAGIAGAVLWTARTPAGVGPTRVLPDGCVDLLWSSRAGLLVAGPDRRAFLSQGQPGERWVGLRLPPGTGPAVLGVPAVELRDRRVPLAALWGDRPAAALAARLEDNPARARQGDPALAGLGDPARARAEGGPGTGRGRDLVGDDVARVLVGVVASRLREAGGPDPLAARVTAALAAGAPVAEVAARAGLDPRALHRRARHLFGYGPKTLARILRLQRALALARAGTPLAEVAARAGYADQAHLTRDTRDLAGVPPTALLGR